VASRVVLDDAGAEQLPYIKGRAIYQTDRKHIVQTPFIENDTIEKIIKPHIVIKAKKEVQRDTPTAQSREGRSYSLIIEETRLSQ
jgi:S-DNA-T family DNA segregation ATPase FtsK/SpoIIIE